MRRAAHHLVTSLKNRGPLKSLALKIINFSAYLQNPAQSKNILPRNPIIACPAGS